VGCDPLAAEREVSVFKTILWATDGSENADRALAVARALAQTDSAAVIVAHVVQRYAKKGGLAGYPDEEQVEARLKRLVDELVGERVDASLRIVEHVGPLPAHDIADIACEAGADLHRRRHPRSQRFPGSCWGA
jgi:nucleotide-binding universal stress UspA family protein